MRFGRFGAREKRRCLPNQRVREGEVRHAAAFHRRLLVECDGTCRRCSLEPSLPIAGCIIGGACGVSDIGGERRTCLLAKAKRLKRSLAEENVVCCAEASCEEADDQVFNGRWAQPHRLSICEV